MAATLPTWIVPVGADEVRPARPQPDIVPGDWEGWLDRWWVEPELEWDDNPEGVDVSIDAEIGHMLTDRLGIWGRPAYHADDGGETEDWDLRFGIRYRLN